MMKKLILFFSFVLVLSSLTYPQLAQIDIPITAVNGSYSQELRVGLDTGATNCIDPALGEYAIPPCPPVDMFDILWDIGIYNCPYQNYTYKDYRHANFPFTGIIEHKLLWQLHSSASTLVLNYNLPPGAVMNIKDPLGGIVFNSGNLYGSGSFDVPFPGFNQAIVTLTYSNIYPGNTQSLITFSPPSINFLNVAAGNSSTLPVTLTNVGNSELIISAITSSDPQFSYTFAALPCTIAAGGTTGIMVNFTPTTLGLQSTNLLFSYNAPSSPTTLYLQGNGNSVMDFTPSTLDFSNVAIGHSLTIPVIINNRRDSELTISDITSANSRFTFTFAALPFTIAAHQTAEITVTFTPNNTDVQTADLVFTHNSPDSPTLYPLKGNGNFVPEICDSITVSDQVGGIHDLYFGGDPIATDGYDTQFQEGELPPLPPSGAFDVRLYLPEDNFSGIARSYRDFRYMENLPYTGQKEFRIKFQPGFNSPGIRISWSFPGYLTGILQDLYGGLLVNIPMHGSGFYNVIPDVNILKMIVEYNNAGTASPVELTSFTTSVNAGTAILNWQTATEINNRGFDIERKSFNSKWKIIGFIDGSGTSTSIHSYSFTDKPLYSGSYTYRLKQIDLDGSFSYSKEVNAEIKLAVNNFALNQNYPNPFNPATAISFNIPKASPVKIVIYDILGNEIKVLFNEDVQPGTYYTTWNGISYSGMQMSSGTYIYKLTAGEFIQSKKMILMK